VSSRRLTFQRVLLRVRRHAAAPKASTTGLAGKRTKQRAVGRETGSGPPFNISLEIAGLL
jgi:hypothetical protein